MAHEGYEVRNFFATAARGTEGAVRDELRDLRFRGVRAERGGVSFEGPLIEGFHACLALRTPLRVLMKLGAFACPSGEALYEGARAIDWLPLLTPRHTLAIRAFCRSSALTHSQFIAQKTKDAIVDQIRDRVGARPSVSLDDPDVAIFVHVVRDEATIYADLSGGSMHKRGYRARAQEAPLKESLAAALLRLAGWDRSLPLLDPMCGSGTFAIEAALWSRRIAPGLLRDRFGFERWASHGDREARDVADLRAEARDAILRDGPRIEARDADPESVAIAAENAQRAGVSIALSRRRVEDLERSSSPGFILTNPPYGERLASPEDLYHGMARALRGRSQHTVAILSGTPLIARAMQIRADREHTVYNGDIECRLLTYSIR